MSPVSTPAKTGSGAALDARALATTMFSDLAAMSFDGEGISRPTYGAGETEAMQYMAKLAESEGLETWFDAAANLMIELPGADPSRPFMACGSHLDSVPQGGNYDGAAGVVAGMLALIRMKRSGDVPPRTIRLYALRGEESAWFGRCYLGSMSMFGKFPPEAMDSVHRDDGQTLESHMKACGADVDKIKAGHPLVHPAEMAGFIELHIEQGPVMIARDIPVGVVTGIRGNIRHPKIICRGEAGHSGAVPRWLRRDAVFAVADLLTRLDEHWRVLLERGLDIVLTTGIFSTNPAEHAMSRIPGEASFSFEVRSQSIETLEAFYHLLEMECRSISEERKVTFDFDQRILSQPARMDERWVKKLLESCERREIKTEKLASGAGHDASVFANSEVPTAMIFVRNANGSHNPQEAMDIDDFMLGADVLFDALINPL